jgi:quinol monooxygenase YgiN
MIIAIVDFEVAAGDRATALAVLGHDGPAARALPGNLSYRAFTNADSDSHVGIMHEWEKAEHFEGYMASAAFAEIGRQLRPLMTAPPISRRMTAELFEEVKG